MKKNRDMFYQDYQAGGFTNPPMMYNNTPSGFLTNNHYQAFGPNVVPEQINNNYDINDYESRITKIERQIRKIDTRLSILEKESSNEIINNDLYVI